MQVLEDRDYLCAVEDGLLEVEVLNGAMISEEVATSQDFGDEIDVSIIL